MALPFAATQLWLLTAGSAVQLCFGAFLNQLDEIISDVCWPEGGTLTYTWCCSDPPGTENYKSSCFDVASGSEWQTHPYDVCCFVHHGQALSGTESAAGNAIRSLPAHWVTEMRLVFPKANLRLRQYPKLPALRGFTGSNRTLQHMSNQVLLEGLVWHDGVARLLLGSQLFAQLRAELGRRLTMLDLGTGLGLNVLAALASGHFDLAVGLDRSSSAVARALQNLRLNGFRRGEGAHILAFDVCWPVEELLHLLSSRLGTPSSGSRRSFDVFSFVQLSLAPEGVRACIFELLLATSQPAPGFSIFVDSDSIQRAWVGKYSREGYPDFGAYAASRGFSVVSTIYTTYGAFGLKFLPSSFSARPSDISPLKVWKFWKEPHSAAS